MNIQIKSQLDTTCDILVLGLFEEDTELYSKYNPHLSEDLANAIKNKRLEREFGKTYATKITNSAYEHVLIVSLGKKSEFKADHVRRAMQRIVHSLNVWKHKSATTNILDLVKNENKENKFTDKELGRLTAEGLILSDYVFDKYLTKKTDSKIDRVSLQFIESKDFIAGIAEGKTIADATNFAKDLVNEPSNVVTPTYLEKTVKQLFLKNPKIKITILEKKDMEKLGMGALLGVTKASSEPPKLIVIQYNGGSVKEKPTAIVGKGITFDAGGYDIKPAGKFVDMKIDMSGAAAVIGTIKVMSELSIKKNIVGIIPSCENMVDGSAQKPGDIVKAFNGKTIEIANTDAEGRLILADAIAYAEKTYGPDKIIDLATLTGACIVALGFYASGLVSNDEQLSKDLIDAGNASYDRVWPLPFYEEFQDLMDGDITDLKNLSKQANDRAAGTITGGVFISKFVDKAKWAHLDIAGTAFVPEEKEYTQKYATGAGIRLLTYYFMK
jgi:leucyl aminopeptidase